MKNLYFCENCRCKLDDLGKIHFVEDNSDRGFCSEKCILEFYRPYMEVFEREEVEFRKALNILDNEGHNEILGSDHYLQLALNNPSEIWYAENELEQKFYSHFLQTNIDGHDYYIILICSYIDGSPSFVYYRTITSSEELVNKYRRDEILDEDKLEESLEEISQEELTLAAEVIEEIERKKSSLLADMIQNRLDSDISLESFTQFDKYLEKTIHDPDEIYEFEDLDGDNLLTCIKSYHENNQSFFYITIAYPYKNPKNPEQTMMIPIIGFPSTDKNLYPKYATGKRLDETLKN